MPFIIYKGVHYNISQIISVINRIRSNGSSLTTISIIMLLTGSPYTTSSIGENINFGKFLSTYRILLGLNFIREVPYFISCGKRTTTALWQ